MRFFLVLTMVLFATSALANEKENGKSLEDKKAKLISGLDQRISELQKSKSCILEAKDEKGLSECRKGKNGRREKLRKKLQSKNKFKEEHKKAP